MPDISAVSLANVVAQAQAGGYRLGAPGVDFWPPGFQQNQVGQRAGLNPQPLPPGSLMQGGRGVGPGRLLTAIRQLLTPAPRHAQAGQTYGSFGSSPTPAKPPLCSDTRYWVDGAPPGNCINFIPFNPISVQLGEPQQPCKPVPCSPTPCAPQPCSPTPCTPTDGSPLGGMNVCPPCPAPIPWGWMVITSVFALLGGLQFYGKVGGGKLS